MRKIITVGLLAAIIITAIAAGAGAFPNAAIAGDGYTYTERTCREYGRHSRQYLVRDPIPGSDWRNDGGWAIVMERTSRTAAQSIVRTTFRDEFSDPQFTRYFDHAQIQPLLAAATGDAVTDNSGGPFDGLTGRASTTTSGLVWIDQNGDGSITADDKTAGPDNDKYELLTFTITESSNYGAHWIRWVNFRSCR